MMFRDARKGQLEWRKMMTPLLGCWAALLGMKCGLAPPPVAAALRKNLLRKGFPNDLGELTIFACRFLFLGDAWMLLAEPRSRTATTPSDEQLKPAVSKNEIAACYLAENSTKSPSRPCDSAKFNFLLFVSFASFCAEAFEPPTPGAILKTYWNDVVPYTLKFSLFPRAEEAATG